MDAARLTGQIAVVTGGALGIGGGISRRLAAAGAHVVLADIDADAAEAARREIATAGGHCTTVIGDIREPEVVSLVAHTALEVADSHVGRHPADTGRTDAARARPRPDHNLDPGRPLRPTR